MGRKFVKVFRHKLGLMFSRTFFYNFSDPKSSKFGNKKNFFWYIVEYFLIKRKLDINLNLISGFEIHTRLGYKNFLSAFFHGVWIFWIKIAYVLLILSVHQWLDIDSTKTPVLKFQLLFFSIFLFCQFFDSPFSISENFANSTSDKPLT